jgi:hypothetical protein
VLGVQVLDELGQGCLPRFLLMVVELSELGRVQSEFAGHPHVCVGEPVAFACVDPGL